jgi:lysophospholipase L1-like esterase
LTGSFTRSPTKNVLSARFILVIKELVPKCRRKFRAWFAKLLLVFCSMLDFFWPEACSGPKRIEPYAIAMNAVFRLCLALALGIGTALPQNVPPPSTASARSAPQPGDADFPAPSPSARHDEKVVAARSGRYDLVLIGDSITHTLGELGGKYEPLKQAWDRHFAPRHALNLGYSGYRTEQILWNLDNGELDFAQSPKVAILLIGTNNSDDRHFPKVHTPEEIFAGTKAIVDRIHQRHPTTKILLLRIFPRGGDTEAGVSPPPFNSSAQCIQTCQRAGELTAQLADGQQVFWLDVNYVFLRPDGTINTDLMWDLLHPSPAEGKRS